MMKTRQLFTSKLVALLLLFNSDSCLSAEELKPHAPGPIPEACQGDFKLLKSLSVRSSKQDDLYGPTINAVTRVTVDSWGMVYYDNRGNLLSKNRVRRLDTGQLQISGFQEMHFPDRKPERFPVVTTNITFRPISERTILYVIHWDPDSIDSDLSTVYTNDSCWILERLEPTKKENASQPPTQIK